MDFAEEMKGVAATFLESPGVKQADGTYRVMANITWHLQAVSSHADNPGSAAGSTWLATR